MSNTYVTLDEFASYLGATDTSNVIIEFAEECIETASRDIDAHCGRRFYQEVASADPATAREFRSVSPYRVFIDDCYEAPTVVATDDGDNGTFTATWAAADYMLEPRNGIDAWTGQTGVPYTSICAVLGRTFPCIVRSTNVKVTARWGWAAVPSAVKSACRRLAHLQYEARKAPFGAAGNIETGYIRIRDDKLATQLLEPFVRKPILIG